MFAFWDSVIEPVLEIVGPKDVVEVGADLGNATGKLLEFAERNGATLHSVDPAPNFDVAALKDRYGERFVFHEGLSLDVILGLPRFDVVLLDGDHNFYSVRNELELIDRARRERGDPFPLVFLHDVDFPYGRRDLYYVPETIPEEHRHPHGGGGLRPEEPGLVPGGGLNPGAANAVMEGGPRNGVLTAVEDFLEEHDHELELVRLRGLYGLGILFPRDLRKEAPGFADFLGSLGASPAISRHIEILEDARIESEIGRHEGRLELQELRTRVRDLANTNDGLVTRNASLEEANGKLRKANQRLRERRNAFKEKGQDLADRNAQLERELAEARRTIGARAAAAVGELRRKIVKR